MMNAERGSDELKSCPVSRSSLPHSSFNLAASRQHGRRCAIHFRREKWMPGSRNQTLNLSEVESLNILAPASGQNLLAHFVRR
jgi:hypothetical protein